MNSLIALLVAFYSLADWHDIGPKEFDIPSPPAKDSRAYDLDFEVLHKFQKKRSSQDCKEASSMTFPTMKALFGGTYGVLSQSELNDSEELMGEVFKLTEKICGYFKTGFKRARPYDTDPSLEPCVKKPGGAKSYPSSHSAIGVVGGCLLSKVFPNKAKVLKAHGRRIGELRVIGGVHHPSDVLAGRDIGQQLCNRLLEEKDFVKELEEIR